MIYIKNLIKTVAFALNIFSLQFSQLFKTRIIVIILFYSGVLAFNTFYIQSIGSGIRVYIELFHFATISQQLDIFISKQSLLLNSLKVTIFKLFNKT